MHVLSLIRLTITCVCIFFSCMGFVLAQNAHADSLERSLRATTNYDERIRLLGELSDYYSYSDSAKAMDYALRIKELARSRNDERGLGIAHYRIGGVYFELNQADSAMSAYEAAARFLQADTSRLAQQTLARVWNNHGAVYQWKGDADTYLDMLLNRAIPIQERLNDSVGMGRNFYNIGGIFQNAREYDRAIHYYQKSTQALDPYSGVPELPDAYIKLAESMTLAGYAEDEQRRTIRQSLQKADTILNRYPDAYSRVYYFNAVGVYTEMFEKDLDEALGYYQQGYQLAYENKLPRQASASLVRAYNVYDKQGNYQEALRMIRQASEYYEYFTPLDRLTMLGNMMHTQEKLGNIREAYFIQKQYLALNDSLHAVEMALKIHDLEQKFEAKEKEAQIMRLNQQMQDQELRTQRTQFIAILLGVTILLVVGISLAGYNIFRKKQLIAKQQAELLQQKMAKMKQDQHISVFGAMLEGQEQERKRLAIDLHDGLGGSLSSIKLKLSKTIQDFNGQASGSALPTIVSQLDRSIDELRRIARNMMPETLLNYGLAAALRDFCKGMESNAVKISFQAYGLRDDMPKTTQIMVYRIVQELVTNALKHANASHILAQCLQDEQHLSITVEDDGQGLDMASTSQQITGMGLSNVKNRVAYLGGKLDIHSEQNVGTTINIELAYHDE